MKGDEEKLGAPLAKHTHTDWQLNWRHVETQEVHQGAAAGASVLAGSGSLLRRARCVQRLGRETDEDYW